MTGERTQAEVCAEMPGRGFTFGPICFITGFEMYGRRAMAMGGGLGNRRAVAYRAPHRWRFRAAPQYAGASAFKSRFSTQK